jgi:hypothetical protein
MTANPPRLTSVAALAACLGLSGLAPAAGADTLFLRDGAVITGKYAGGDLHTVRLMVAGTVRDYPVDQVRDMVFGDTRTQAAGPAATNAQIVSTGDDPRAVRIRLVGQTQKPVSN